MRIRGRFVAHTLNFKFIEIDALSGNVLKILVVESLFHSTPIVKCERFESLFCEVKCFETAQQLVHCLARTIKKLDVKRVCLVILESISYLVGHSVAHEVVVTGFSVLVYAYDCFVIDHEYDLFELVCDVLNTCDNIKSLIKRCVKK